MAPLLHRAAIKKKKKPQGKNIMSASATQGGHNNVSTVTTLGTTIFITINQSIVPQTVTCIKFAFEFSLSNFYHFARYLIIYAQTSVHQTELSEIVLPK